MVQFFSASHRVASVTFSASMQTSVKMGTLIILGTICRTTTECFFSDSAEGYSGGPAHTSYDAVMSLKHNVSLLAQHKCLYAAFMSSAHADIPGSRAEVAMVEGCFNSKQVCHP